jgi:hypothetical protein
MQLKQAAAFNGCSVLLNGQRQLNLVKTGVPAAVEPN